MYDFITENNQIYQLNDFYSTVERLLTARASPDDMRDPLVQKGARIAYESWLRALIIDDLKLIFPNDHLSWDHQIKIVSKHKDAKDVKIDLVDGSKEYFRDGSAVTSHLGLFDSKQNLELGLVSYPFHNFRLLGLKDHGLFYLPFTYKNYDANRLHISFIRKHRNEKSKNVLDLTILDRYGDFQIENPVRQKLDSFRYEMREYAGKYSIPRGSVAKNIMDVALGRKADVAICKHDAEGNMLVPAHDYLTPASMLEMVGGVFRDLNGDKPDGVNPINGFIACKNQAVYDSFAKYIGL